MTNLEPLMVLGAWLQDHGALPPVAKANKDVQALERKLFNKLQNAQAGVEAELQRQLAQLGRLPSTGRGRRKVLRKVMDTMMGTLPGLIADGAEEAAQAGAAASAAEAATLGHAIDLADDGLDPAAIVRLREKVYTFSQDTIGRIQGTFVKTMEDAYRNGEGIDGAIRLLRKDFTSFRHHRLEAIARTEIQGAQNWGAEQLLKNLRVEFKQWLTVEDDRVRGYDPADEYDHIHMHGQVVRTNEPFSNGLAYPGDQTGALGNFINCVPGDTLVSASHVVRAYRRWYEGDMVTIHLADGTQLSATVNHPTFTDTGKVAFGDIVVGTNVLRNPSNTGQGVTVGEHHVYDSPTPIQQVYQTLVDMGEREHATGSHMDFHGDGMNADVEIVAINGLLTDGVHANPAESVHDGGLTEADVLSASLSSHSATTEFVTSARRAANCAVGGSDLVGALGLSHVRPFQAFGFTGSTGRDALRHQPIDDSRATEVQHLSDAVHADPVSMEGRDALVVGALPRVALGLGVEVGQFQSLGTESLFQQREGDSELGGDVLTAESLSAQFDSVVKVERYFWSGHVYNLETCGGWYWSNTILQGNCRCRQRPYIPRPDEKIASTPYYP